MEEAKQTNFRVTPEAADKFREYCKENGFNQAQGFAYDSYRRFIQMYSDVVMEVPKSFFEKIID